MANDFNRSDPDNPSFERGLRLWLFLAILWSLMAAPSTVSSAELGEIVRDYRSERQQLSQLTKSSRRTAIESVITPILLVIGRLDTPASYRFLEMELASARSELLGALASGLLASSRQEVVPLLLKKAYAVGGQAKIEILGNMSRAPRDFRAYEAVILRIFRSDKSLPSRRALVLLLAKIDTLASAKALFAKIRTVKGDGQRRKALIGLNDEIFQALNVKTDEAIRNWLTADAFDKVSREQVLTLLRLVEAKNLTEARPRVIALLKHRDLKIVRAACDTVRRIGVENEVGALLHALENLESWDVRFQIMALDMLASLNDPEALDAVLRVARSDDVDLKTLALGSLRYSNRDLRLLETLLAALRHSKLQVRNAALNSLVEYRDRNVVGALVEFLACERNRRLRVEASLMLIRMTGQDFGLESQDWSNWWEISKDNFDVAKERASATSVRRLKYFGLEVRAQNVAFVVDISGSMNDGLYGFKDVVGGDGGGRKIDLLKKELAKIIRKLPESARINIVPFNQSAMPWKARLHALTSGGRKRALSFVEKLTAGGETNIYDSLEFVLKDEDVEAVYLLTDGMSTRGQFVAAGDVLSNIQVVNRIRGIKIHCVAFGNDSYILQLLARDSGGDYRKVREWKAAPSPKTAPESETPSSTKSDV